MSINYRTLYNFYIVFTLNLKAELNDTVHFCTPFQVVEISQTFPFFARV